ncbi:VacJ [Aquaspirillum sp. LM1]|jgi:hypothetical protein|uniref:VacJ n=1 Tax=Aquaspirillum sp. LM1 TaxID=1938604 RepID=UPI000983A436|nr:VacJ [Aquaspirillum sp. LM1]AQR66247.1 VacJ [Aquaspirillum sp. LM1]
MYEVNRSVAIVKPKQPFFDWLNSLPFEQDETLTLHALRQDCNALLIPPAEDFEDAREFIRSHWRSIFDAELADWCEDDTLWPEKRTPNLFQQWFDVEVHSVLTDLVSEPLEREAFAELDLDGDDDGKDA